MTITYTHPRLRITRKRTVAPRFGNRRSAYWTIGLWILLMATVSILLALL